MPPSHPSFEVQRLATGRRKFEVAAAKPDYRILHTEASHASNRRTQRTGPFFECRGAHTEPGEIDRRRPPVLSRGTSGDK